MIHTNVWIMLILRIVYQIYALSVGMCLARVSTFQNGANTGGRGGGALCSDTGE
jgi:hypothetical protein